MTVGLHTDRPMGRALKRSGLTVVAAAAVSLGAGPTTALAATDVDLFEDPGGSFLSILGEANVDTITLSESGGVITITDTGPGGIGTTDSDCTAVNPATVTCGTDPTDPAPPAPPALPVSAYGVTLGSGDDSFTNQNFEVFGDVSPDDGADIVHSGPGDDFDDSLGDDSMDGGAGDDTLDATTGAPGNGADGLEGGAGDDEVDYGGAPGSVAVSFDGAPNDGLAGEGDDVTGIETAFGSDRPTR